MKCRTFGEHFRDQNDDVAMEYRTGLDCICKGSSMAEHHPSSDGNYAKGHGDYP